MHEHARQGAALRGTEASLRRRRQQAAPETVRNLTLRFEGWKGRKFWATGPAYIAYRSDVRPIRSVRIARASRDWSRFAPTS